MANFTTVVLKKENNFLVLKDISPLYSMIELKSSNERLR